MQKNQIPKSLGKWRDRSICKRRICKVVGHWCFKWLPQLDAIKFAKKVASCLTCFLVFHKVKKKGGLAALVHQHSSSKSHLWATHWRRWTLRQCSMLSERTKYIAKARQHVDAAAWTHSLTFYFSFYLFFNLLLLHRLKINYIIFLPIYHTPVTPPPPVNGAG